MKLKLFLAFMLILSLISCGNKVQDLQKVTDAKALELNTIFENAMQAAKDGASIAQKAFENQVNLNLDTKKMDKSNGGKWEWFKDYIYWQGLEEAKRNGYTNSFYNVGYLPEDVELTVENSKKISKFLTPNSREFEKAKMDLLTVETFAKDWLGTTNKLPSNVWYEFLYLPKILIQTHSFPMDVSSSVPPGLTHEIVLNYTEWYRTGVPEGNLGLENKWANDAFAGQVGEGYLIPAYSPFKVNGKYKGANTINILISPLAAQFIKPMKENIILISKAGALLGLSSSAKALSIFKDLEEYNYVEQQKGNPNFIQEFKLTNSTQPQEIQELGKKILAGENNIKINLKGKNYTFVTSPVKEVGFTVVGFTE